MTGRMYCTRCDDYGHATEDHKAQIHHPDYNCLCEQCRDNKFLNDFVSKSQVRRFRVVKGDDWWIDEEAEPNGIGPVCIFCKRLIDWALRDHAEACPVRTYLASEEE